MGHAAVRFPENIRLFCRKGTIPLPGGFLHLFDQVPGKFSGLLKIIVNDTEAHIYRWIQNPADEPCSGGGHRERQKCDSQTGLHHTGQFCTAGGGFHTDAGYKTGFQTEIPDTGEFGGQNQRLAPEI